MLWNIPQTARDSSPGSSAWSRYSVYELSLKDNNHAWRRAWSDQQRGRLFANTSLFLMLNSYMVSVSLEASSHCLVTWDSVVTRWVTLIPHLRNWLYDPNVGFHIYLHQNQIILKVYEGRQLSTGKTHQRNFCIQLSKVCLFNHIGSSNLKCRMGKQPFSWKLQTVIWSTLTLTGKNPHKYLLSYIIVFC